MLFLHDENKYISSTTLENRLPTFNHVKIPLILIDLQPHSPYTLYCVEYYEYSAYFETGMVAWQRSNN